MSELTLVSLMEKMAVGSAPAFPQRPPTLSASQPAPPPVAPTAPKAPTTPNTQRTQPAPSAHPESRYPVTQNIGMPNPISLDPHWIAQESPMTPQFLGSDGRPSKWGNFLSNYLWSVFGPKYRNYQLGGSPFTHNPYTEYVPDHFRRGAEAAQRAMLSETPYNPGGAWGGLLNVAQQYMSDNPDAISRFRSLLTG